MFTFDEIEKLLGKDFATYARNKRTGGDNNDKGGKFENQYAVSKIAEMASECVANGSDGSAIQFDAQVVGFIDDLAIHTPTTQTYCQIKDVENLDWFNGKRPLQKDFELQDTICASRGLQTQLELVVSRAEVALKLLENKPASIDVAIVHEGPHGHEYHELPEQLCNWLSGLVEPWENPSNVENARKYLLSAWTTRNGATSLSELVAEAAELSSCSMRSLGPDFDLSPELASYLDQVSGLQCWTRGMRFSCEAEGLLVHASFVCGSSEWHDFEQTILRDRPDALEIALMALRG